MGNYLSTTSKKYKRNIILNTDSYKVTHHTQYPKGTTEIYSYFESRGGLHETVCFYGLQYYLIEYLQGCVVTKEMIDEASDFYDEHFNNKDLFNRKGWEYIVNNCNGNLPIEIKAVPEGTCLPYKNVLFTIRNTDPKCFWLTNFLETLLVQVWYTMTIATNSREMKKVIKKYMNDTCDNLNGIEFKLHDFGCRGVSSMETAALGGSAHLISFLGTDTVPALKLTHKYYDSTKSSGFSIPATEHSTVTSWKESGELKCMENFLDNHPSGIIAFVSDSYDIYNACKNFWGEKLHDKIMNRNGTLVIRPDSGEPCEVLEKIFGILEEKFPVTINSKGYKVLDDHVRVIQGDGIDINSMEKILKHLKNLKWSAENIGFGSGGGLLQKFNRDTQKCALKCSRICVNGEYSDVFKNPITDPGKKSKKGYLTLQKNENGYFTKCNSNNDDFKTDKLVTVFRNGKVIKKYKFDEIRKNANIK
jgi:nicotinamide phosphoribosyltransferase